MTLERSAAYPGREGLEPLHRAAMRRRGCAWPTPAPDRPFPEQEGAPLNEALRIQ